MVMKIIICKRRIEITKNMMGTPLAWAWIL
jgi:hypothetical protein